MRHIALLIVALILGLFGSIFAFSQEVKPLQNPPAASVAVPASNPAKAAIIQQAVDAVDARQAPWWQRSDEFQASAIKWIGVFSTISVALSILVAKILSEIKTIKASIKGAEPVGLVQGIMGQEVGRMGVQIANALAKKSPFLDILEKSEVKERALPLIALCAILPFISGCAWYTAHKAQIGATGSVLAKRAASIAGQIIINSAVSALDSGNKADFLDSAALGLRSELPNVVTGDDLAKVVQIWTPQKSHWDELADNLGHIYDSAQGTPGQKLEAVARGLNDAAATARSNP